MRIAFVATQRCRPWGASEEFWGCAAREALRVGHAVHAAPHAQSSLVSRVGELARPDARLDALSFGSAGCGRILIIEDPGGTIPDLPGFKPVRPRPCQR